MGAIVFDLDGTLVDSAPDIMAVANAVLAAEGADPLTLPETKGFIGNGARVFVERMIAARRLSAGDLPRLHADFMRRYDTAHETATFYPGVVQVLTGLRDRGHLLGLCTNKPLVPAQRLLDHLGIAGLFAAVIGGDSLPVNKPDPAPLRAAFAPLGAPTLYVGDSEVDHATALAAGVPFALFSGGYRRTPVSDFRDATVFDDWADLPGIVAGL